MRNPIAAGLAYFAAIFAIGFVFGTVRVLLLEHRVGVEAAIALEIPFMLAVSFFVARWLIVRLHVSAALLHRLAMGSVALALLLAAETALALALGQSLREQAAGYATLRGALTALGQAGFLVIPLLVRAPSARDAIRADRVGT